MKQTWNLKNDKNEHIYKTENRLPNIENIFMATKGEMWWRRDKLEVLD